MIRVLVNQAMQIKRENNFITKPNKRRQEEKYQEIKLDWY
jgi:hypothetical protein